MKKPQTLPAFSEEEKAKATVLGFGGKLT